MADDDRDHRQATPVGVPDPVTVASFWARCGDACDIDPSAPVPPAWCFGDSVELANELIELVIRGTKRATASAVSDYEAEAEPLPVVGDRAIVTDGSMRPRAVLEVTEVRVGPLSSVDAEFAWDEGEGDRTRQWWLDAHTRYFNRLFTRLSLEFHADIPVVFERFEVVYVED